MLAQTTLRAVLGQHELDEMLSERKKLSTDVQSILDTQTETWGIKVSNVEIRTVELTENMVRAIAKQAEAERDRRAKIIHAEAEPRNRSVFWTKQERLKLEYVKDRRKICETSQMFSQFYPPELIPF
jgi:regulator of protease activity HflC (stomatin/prohibitin superfamily)